MRILVTGATGLIGCHSVAALLDVGAQVRVFVRDASKIDRVLASFGRSAEDIEIALGDLSDQGSLRAALDGCSGLLHCAGIFSPERQDEARLIATNVEGTRAVLEAATQCELERAVYVSSMLALFPPRGEKMTASDEVAQPSSMYARTKADAERVARSYQARLPLTIVYPAAVQGPDDPTFSIGPQLVADALAKGQVLVTEGGLATTDVRDLARVVASIFQGKSPERRIMAPSFFVPHDRYHTLLESITGRALAAQRVPGWVLRIMGRLGDIAQRFGARVQLTYEAAEVLTRSVPLDDSEAVRLLGGAKIEDEESFRDLISWMVEAGHLSAEVAGALKASSEAAGA